MLFIQLYQLTLMVIVVTSLSSANFGDRQPLLQVEERITRQKHNSSPLKAEATAVQPSYSFYHEQHTPPQSYHDGNRYYYQNPGHSYNYGYGNSYTLGNNAGHGGHNGYGNRYDVDQYNYHMPNYNVNHYQEPNSYSYHYNHVQPPYSYNYYQPYEYHYSQPYTYSYNDYKPYQYNYHNSYNY